MMIETTLNIVIVGTKERVLDIWKSTPTANNLLKDKMHNKNEKNYSISMDQSKKC